jgi:hypothetical protein
MFLWQSPLKIFKELFPCRTQFAMATKRKNFKKISFTKPKELELRY